MLTSKERMCLYVNRDQVVKGHELPKLNGPSDRPGTKLHVSGAVIL